MGVFRIYVGIEVTESLSPLRGRTMDTSTCKNRSSAVTQIRYTTHSTGQPAFTGDFQHRSGLEISSKQSEYG